MSPLSSRRRRAAYTLLEILLALALSVVIVGAITAAIGVFLMNLNRHQRSLEQKQVVRSVLLMIANDLRAGLQYKAIDVSGLQNLQVSQALSGILPGMGGGGTGEETEGSASSEAASESSAETDETEDTAEYRPTLIGDRFSVSIDISRLPRLDEYHALLSGSVTDSQTAADIKTVSYFISSNPPLPNSAIEFEPRVSALGGLYRRQVDRAVAAYAGETAGAVAVDQFAKLLAPEIIELQFRYFDGSSWQTSWNSEESGGFPLAVEVTMIFDPNRTVLDRQLSFNDLLELETYRMVVHLPMAEIPVEASQ